MNTTGQSAEAFLKALNNRYKMLKRAHAMAQKHQRPALAKEMIEIQGRIENMKLVMQGNLNDKKNS